MKIKRKFLLIIFAAVMVVTFAGCSFLLGLFNVPLSIEARIILFRPR